MKKTVYIAYKIPLYLFFLNAICYTIASSNTVLASGFNTASINQASYNQNIENTISIIVNKGEKFTHRLQEIGINKNQISLLLCSIKKIYNPNKIRAGQIITLQVNKNKQIIKFEVNIDNNRKLIAYYANNNKFTSTIVANKLTSQLRTVSSFVTEALLSRKLALKVPGVIIKEFISLYTQDKNLSTMIKKGANLELVFEQFVDQNNKVCNYGNLIYFSVNSTDKITIKVFYYKSINQNEGYFYKDGSYFNQKEISFNFPVDSVIVSSPFGYRKHPIYKRKIHHKGVDLVAKVNTPIKSASNGKIEYLGDKGGYGKYIRIKHNENYSTAYAHLNKFASQLKVGAEVKLGQIIGYSGQTGNVTGPHLHYEVIYQGMHIDPMTVHNNIETTQRLEGMDLVKFKRKIAMLQEIIGGY